MRRTLLSIALSALASAAVAADAPAGAPAAATTASAAPAATAPATPLLWKVSDQDNSVYLLGSFHLLKATDQPVGPAVQAAFDDAESLVFEIPPAQLTDPATAGKMQAAMQYADGRTLSTVLPAETRTKLESMLAASGTPLAALDALEPWGVSMVLSLGVMQALGFTPDQGVDKLLIAKAAAAGKPVAGLETIDDQLAALDGQPVAEQVRALDEFVADPKRAVAEINTLHAAWTRGDADALDREFRAEMARETPESYKRLNVDRNERWVPQLEQRLKAAGTDDTLAVVGALHLLGDDGVVERLRAKGYTVERIGTGSAAATR